MVSHFEKSLGFPEHVWPFVGQAFRTAQEVVNSIPEGSSGHVVDPIRCHEVARAVYIALGGQIYRAPYGRESAKKHIGIRFHDGHYITSLEEKRCYCEHSWISFEGSWVRSILDPYAVGSLPQVQLRDSSAFHNHYLSGYLRADVRWRAVGEMLKFYLDSIGMKHLSSITRDELTKPDHVEAAFERLMDISRDR